MMRLTEVEISNMPKCAKQTAILKSFLKSDIYCVRNVGNDHFNYVCHS